jgi:hypothetical protein
MILLRHLAGAFGHRRALMRHHCNDLAAEHLLIKLKRGFALAVEDQIGVQLHDACRCLRIELVTGRADNSDFIGINPRPV